MLKFALVLCFALSPVIGAAGDTAAAKYRPAARNLVAFTGNRTQTLSGVQSDILDTFLLIALRDMKEIELVPQAEMEALHLGYEETSLASIGKAMEPLKAEREICYFVTQNNFGYKIDFYIFEGSNGDTLYLKNETAGNIIDCI